MSASLNYADTLRALGRYLDSSRYRDLTLIESPIGLIVKGRAMSTSVHGTWSDRRVETFADPDLAQLRHAASRNRGLPSSPAGELSTTASAAEGTRYEDTLRAVGQFLDRAGWHDIVLVQAGDCFHLKGRSANGPDEPVHTTLDLRALADLATGLRSRRGRSRPPAGIINR